MCIVSLQNTQMLKNMKYSIFKHKKHKGADSPKKLERRAVAKGSLLMNYCTVQKKVQNN